MINEIKNNFVINSVLTSRLENYVPYNKCNLKILFLENEIAKYTSYFLGKSYFGDDCNQNYLLFQPMSRYLKFVTNSQNISSWRSKELPDKQIKVVNGLYPSVNYVNKKLRLKFEGICLVQTKVTYTHKDIVNIYFVYEIGATTRNYYDLKLINGLLGAVTYVKNSDINKFGYTGYGIWFERGTTFSFSSVGFSHNVLIFGVDMSGSTRIDNKKGHISFRKKTCTSIWTHFNCRQVV